MMYKKPLQLLAVFLVAMDLSGFGQNWNPNHKIGTVDGNYSFAYNETPSQLIEIYAAAIPNTGLAYQWESSPTPLFLSPNIVGTSSSYSPPALTVNSQNTYYRRKTVNPANGSSIYSNIIKISPVSINWEDINYIREHNVVTTGITTWTAVDQLTIGQKLQTTTYLDGLGRSIQKVSRETATPANPNSPWGDRVQFSVYDAWGREPLRYLPYTTTTQSGKYKANPQSGEQAQYYAGNYNEGSAYSTITFDNSPLNRVVNVKSPGTSWSVAAGNSASFDLNTDADDVKLFATDYVKGNAPFLRLNYPSAYPAKTLYKITYTDENGKQVIEFINRAGQLILKKVQLADTPGGPYSGWICTYSVYDDFGLLRYQIQPEGVNFLANNEWTFDAANGAVVFAEQVFQYYYDDKGRTVWKKAPGSAPLNMVFDHRDRVVFMQDGNQAAMATPQWTANIYDELDRVTITTLYNTTKTISALQADINNATVTSNTAVTNPNQEVVDLVLSNRDPSINRYIAISSIEFVSEGGNQFESLSDMDEFVAEIDPTATAPGYTVVTTTNKNPISTSDLNNPAVTTVLKYLFYDGYSFSGAKSFDNSFTNTAAYDNSDANVAVIAKSNRTQGMPTGSLTRILETNTFLASTIYYDEKGRQVQRVEENVKQGLDITTWQYHFDGRIMSSCHSHSAPGTGYAAFITLTKYIFDKLGRVTSIQKKFDNNAFKTISGYDYDDVGRIKSKHLDPNYNNANSGLPDLESLNYSFNIHNQITGINKEYAIKTPGNYSKWEHFFGLYLGFDNRDGVFNRAELNGQVAGLLWNTQGDDAQRKYDFRYDNAGRLIRADFTEKVHTADAWANNKMDFSVKGADGQIEYDLNGNLYAMLQRGVLPGGTAPIDIDNLHYSYAPFSNKLLSVTDQMSSSNVNGSFGDFKDGNNGSGSDYVYDNNGNIVIDLNKNAKDLNGILGADGIKYNFLDKPELIHIAGKGTIEILYSADGEKLKRIFTPEGTGSKTTTTYTNGFVYQASGQASDKLSYINFEEGRIRAVTPISENNGFDALTVTGNITLPTSISADGGAGVFDYFIMDYQQNVRMILSEEVHSAANMCTMETNRAGIEDAIFGQAGGGNEVEATRYPKPVAWTGNVTESVSRLGNIAGKNIGPNVLQKVMAGDNISTTVQYYFQTPGNNSNPNFVNSLLSSLVQAISAGPTTTVVKENVTNINNHLNANSIFTTAVQPAGNGGNTPQAWLTILFFDERFNFIEAADGGVAQQQVDASVGSNGATLGPLTIKAPKNGYVYIYVSNRSDQDVFFDNLNVGVTAGNIIEENHFYAYGLRIAAISSKKLGDSYEGTLDNKNLYNDKELVEDGGLNWYDYGFRNYDPQIGRFMQLDPLAFGYPFYSPYQYAGDEPIANVDLDGLEPLEKTLEKVAEEAAEHGGAVKELGLVIVKSTPKVTSKGGLWHGVGRFFKGALDGVVETVSFAVNIFNPDLSKNSLVQTGKFVYQAVTDPVGTSKAVWNAIKTTDWSDPATYGKIFSTVITPGAAAKIVKYLSKAVLTGSRAARIVQGVEGVSTSESARFSSASKALAISTEELTGNAAKSGITVLGKMGFYEKLAEELGANKFVVKEYTWEANKKFLDDAIARGDKFVLANSPVKANGVFGRELEYLINDRKIFQNGYKISEDGMTFYK